MLTLSYILRQAGSILVAYATKIEDMPERLNMLADFLEKEPNNSFKTTLVEGLEVPLTLNSEEAEERFKNFTEKYKEIYNGAIMPSTLVKRKFYNLLNAVGQVLSNIGIVFEGLLYKHSMADEEKGELKSYIEALYHVWGSVEGMNSKSLVEKFTNISTGDTKRTLISKLRVSASLIEKKILPLV